MIAVLLAAAAYAAPMGELPASALAGLGLGAPTRDARTPELQRYPLGDPGSSSASRPAVRGFVTVVVSADAAAADQAFDGLQRTAATFWPPAATPSFAVDRSAGDLAQIALVRVENAVVLVRDRDGHAGTVARDVVGALPR
jgi:hypothetical protein